MSPYSQIIYCSRRNPSTDPEASNDEVRDILTAAREMNAEHDITGALLSSAGCFAQGIEGSPEAVEQLFSLIRVDPRHHDIVRLLTRVVPERMFPDWSMGFTTPAGEYEIASAVRIVERAFRSSVASADDQEAAGVAVCELIQSQIGKAQIW